MTVRPLSLAAVLCGVASLTQAAAWTGAPSPHDAAHLVVLHAGTFRTVKGEPVALQKEPGAAFDGQAVRLVQPVVGRLQVRHAGKYALWIRLAALQKLRSTAPVQVRLEQDDDVLLTGTVNQGRGKVGAGGPDGYEEYARLAKKTGAAGSLDKTVAGFDLDADNSRAKNARKAAEIEDDLLADLKKESGEKPRKDWTHDTRLDEAPGDRPFYWWNSGSVELQPGSYQLRLTPDATARPDAVVSVDAAFLTTSTEVVYPFAGDIDAPPASYIRFRIDEVPEAGVSIGAALRVHYDPWSTGHVWLNPGKMQELKAEPHTATGMTRWYRLQDIERGPAFGASEAHLHLDIKAARNGGTYRGATQFAVYPHQDFVLREINWAEPEGLRVSMVTDFETYLHRLRTLRDHAREDYERALTATQNRLFPLTRGDLYFGNAWGASSGECTDYMAKTLRLLGFNSVGQATEPLAYRKLYGWTSHTGAYWPPAHLPFDEDASRRQYDDFYKSYFDKDRELYEGVSIFQLADEPGEIAREEMSSPLWRLTKSADGDKYVDASGNSELTTRRCDLSNCVLEGKVEKHGGWFGFRVGVDNPNTPKTYAYWHLGLISQNREFNLAAGKHGRGPDAPALATRPGAVIAATPTEFKIVYEGNSAALYIGKRLVHQHTGLPAKGGFGFAGPAKAIHEVRLRPLRKDEHITADSPDVALDDADKDKGRTVIADLDGDDLLDPQSGKLPDWAQQKPLARAVREDWVIGGGMPEAHAAFRTWARSQGLSPETFGEKAWDDVRMLTLPALVATASDARLFYYSRKFCGYLTPRMFAMAADAIHKYAPNPRMQNFVALSGHALYFPSAMPLDMFQLASGSPAMMPGVSDWMSLGSWRWDSHQAVAFSVAMYNAGARRYGQDPLTFPMMHCVYPSDFRAYTMLANQVRYVSFYNFGPSYAVTEGYWSDYDGAYQAVHNTANRAAQVDDLLSAARARPSRVALLYSISNEYWNPQSSFADKRAAFLGLSHEYFQPELVTEEQVAADALQHYDALYVLEPIVAANAQSKIAAWVRQGGLLWTCADSLKNNEFNEPHDLLAELTGIERTFPAPTSEEPLTAKTGAAKKTAAKATPPTIEMHPVPGGATFRPHAVSTDGLPAQIKFATGKVRERARYNDGRNAWLEAPAGKGKVVYLGHRPGLTYTAKAIRRGGYHTIWADTARASLTLPLHEAQVDRELVLSEPVIVATPLSTADGTVIILYNMQPSPVRDLAISLKEPQTPDSVQAFDGDVLHDLPFEYREGRVHVKLEFLDAGQMVVVRRKAAPADPRLAQMQAEAVRQLQSDDWRALSAGAWFAGHFPQWNLTAEIVPLLTHERWEVRRAAAESLGRSGKSDLTKPIIAALESETDAHVIADEVVAIARLGNREMIPLCVSFLQHPDAWVRQQTLRSIGLLAATNRSTASGKPKAEKPADRTTSGDATLKLDADLQSTILALATNDPDFRVRSQAITLAVQTVPEAAVKLAAEAFAETSDSDLRPASRLDQAAWLDALAQHDAAFQAWLTAGSPGGDPVLMGLAARRADPALAKTLRTRWKSLTPEQAAHLTPAAIRQRDGMLTRTLFTHQADLPPAVQAYLPIILEHTFGARLGDVLPDWAAWLKANSD